MQEMSLKIQQEIVLRVKPEKVPTVIVKCCVHKWGVKTIVAEIKITLHDDESSKVWLISNNAAKKLLK